MNALLKRILLTALAGAGASAVFGDAPKAPPAQPAPPRSVFVLPTNPREGRDPFFPESNRPYQEAASTQPVVLENAFAVKGISFEHGRAMVIINNHTFAVGDEGDVLTAKGRMHLRLIEIRRDGVVIEANGARRELGIDNK